LACWPGDYGVKVFQHSVGGDYWDHLIFLLVS
jgi:hypothetical protein